MILNLLRKHFRKHARRRPWDFCWKIGIEKTVVSFAIAFLLLIVLDDSKPYIIHFPIWREFATLVIIAPVIETLLLQAFPIYLARSVKSSFNVQIISSVLIFTVLHSLISIGRGLCAGLIGGYYLAFSYALWRRRSRWSAFWITTVCHSITNATVFIFFLFGEIGEQ